MLNNVYFRKSICLLLVLSIFTLSMTGCGGQAANPVQRYMPGDEKRSCSALLSEMEAIKNEIADKKQKIKDRDTLNFIEFLGGIVIIVPFFFMDCKGSYETEIDALKARQTILTNYFAENGCSAANPSEKQSSGEPKKTDQPNSTNATADKHLEK
jgi:hypothetical protein